MQSSLALAPRITLGGSVHCVAPPSASFCVVLQCQEKDLVEMPCPEGNSALMYAGSLPFRFVSHLLSKSEDALYEWYINAQSTHRGVCLFGTCLHFGCATVMTSLCTDDVDFGEFPPLPKVYGKFTFSWKLLSDARCGGKVQPGEFLLVTTTTEKHVVPAIVVVVVGPFPLRKETLKFHHFHPFHQRLSLVGGTLVAVVAITARP